MMSANANVFLEEAKSNATYQNPFTAIPEFPSTPKRGHLSIDQLTQFFKEVLHLCQKYYHHAVGQIQFSHSIFKLIHTDSYMFILMLANSNRLKHIYTPNLTVAYITQITIHVCTNCPSIVHCLDATPSR